MSQNLITLSLTDEQLADADRALDVLERAFTGLVALDVKDRKGLSRMGPKSEQFCRQILSALGQNPQLVPPSMQLAEAQADLLALDLLRPRLHRLRKLVERADDSEMALGSDVMAWSLEGYAVLKVTGRNQGLEALQRELAGRFYKSRTARPGAPEGVREP